MRNSLRLSLVLFLISISVFIGTDFVYASNKVLEDTLGNRIKVTSSSFIFNVNYGYTEFERPTRINVKIDGVTWLSLTNFADTMSYMGFVANASKGCSASDLPEYDNFNIIVGGSSTSVFGYKSSRITYEAMYSDGATNVVNATQPLSFSNDTDYLHSEAELKSYCGIDDPAPAPNPAPSPTPEPIPTPTPTSVVEPDLEAEEEQTLFKDIVSAVQGGLELYFDQESTLDSVTNFYITDGELGTIKFSDKLDFRGEGFIDELNSLSDVVVISKGVIEIDTTKVTALAGKSAALTMNGLNFLETPIILVDGEEDIEGVVSNVHYDAETGVLTFDVTHFTRFEAVRDDSTIIRKVNYIRDTTWSEQTVYLVLGGGLIISTLVGLGVFILGKKLYNRIRIVRYNKTDLPDAMEVEMENEMVEEVNEEIEEIGVE